METPIPNTTPEPALQPHHHEIRRDCGQQAASGERDSNGVERTGPGRKPRACVECKKQKMKCQILPGDHKCRNCLRRKVDCVFRRVITSSETFGSLPLQNYEHKIDCMREEIRQMSESLKTLVDQGNKTAGTCDEASRYETRDEPGPNTRSPSGAEALSTREDNMGMAMTRENSTEPLGNGEQNGTGSVTVEEPMGSLYEVTRLRNIRSNKAKTARPIPQQGSQVADFISRGVISQSEAQDLYDSFHASLNHYLWVGLEQTHPSFSSVRQSSELLTATILTVTALHIPTSSETFDKCYKEFLSLISSSMFSRYHSIDDVRALCIAAFWLSEGHAIRIATELNLHQSFPRALDGDRDHFLKARLWYMLYVCDHHFSIAYGRPPMVAESPQIREHELFLRSPLADAIDRRVLSQVALMQILTRVHDRFVEPVVGDADFADLRAFNLDVDRWRMLWNPRQRCNEYIGSFPPKGIILYSYFAKLQLNSLAIRGVSLSQGRLSTERREFANMAISAAASILTFVLEEDDMRRALVGTPLYVHTMIAFASVFLMKVATKWNRIMGLNVEPKYVSSLLERMIVLLKSCVVSDRHVLHHIAFGLEKMLLKMGLKPKAPGNRVVGAVSNTGVSLEQEFGTDSAVANGSGDILEHHRQPEEQSAILTAGADDGSWNVYTAGGMSQEDGLGDFIGMNDNLIYEAFGGQQANDVYNLLTNQFCNTS